MKEAMTEIYSKEEVEVIQAGHTIKVSIELTVGELKKALAHVPDSATIESFQVAGPMGVTVCFRENVDYNLVPRPRKRKYAKKTLVESAPTAGGISG